MSSSSSSSYDRFELICLKGSPFSERVRWALAKLEVDDYAVIKHAACSGELYLRYKVGNYNLSNPCTVPQALIYSKDSSSKPLILGHGLDIVEWANDNVAHKRGDDDDDDAKLLIPKAYRQHILNYCSMADEIQEYDRGKFFEKVKKDPQQLKHFIALDPDAPPPPPDFMLPYVVKMMSAFMGTKYKSTLQSPEQKRQSIDDNLKKLTETLKAKSNPDDKTYFLVGNSLSLADLYLCVSLYNPIFEKKEDDDDSNDDDGEDDGDDWNVRKQYPVVYEWAKTMSKQYGRFDWE